MMRLVVVTNLFPNPMEPQYSTFNEQQIVALGARVPVSVVCPVGWVRKLNFLRKGRASRLRQCREWRGIPVRYPTYFYVPRILGWTRGVSMAFSITRAFARARSTMSANAVLATWAFPDGFAALLLGRLTRLPVIIKVHGSDVEALQVPGLQRRIALWALRQAEGVVSVSKYLKDALMRQGVLEGKIHVIYNGIDREKFRVLDRDTARAKLGLDPKRRLVLFVGSLKHDKGVRELIHPMVMETCRRGDAVIGIAGSGPLRGEIEQQIASRRLQDRVLLLGSIPPVSVAQWMNAADCLCLPSHHEGLPNVIMEALACGTPVVATRVGGVPEILDDRSGRLVEPQLPGPLAEAISQVLRCQWDREEIARLCPAGGWSENATALEHAIRTGMEAACRSRTAWRD